MCPPLNDLPPYLPCRLCDGPRYFYLFGACAESVFYSRDSVRGSDISNAAGGYGIRPCSVDMGAVGRRPAGRERRKALTFRALPCIIYAAYYVYRDT